MDQKFKIFTKIGLQISLWFLKFTQFYRKILIFCIVGLKKIIVSKINSLWKIKVSFNAKKNMSTIFFAPKLNNLWLLLCQGFWGSLELYSFSKMVKNLDSWPLDMPQKSEHWAGLKLNNCPVSKLLNEEGLFGIF